jgi:DNA-binding transcriptional regulator YiaG
MMQQGIHIKLKSTKGAVEAAPNPTPEEIRFSREASGLTQTEAGKLLHTTCRTWQQWEAGDRRMHPAFWELFQIKLAMRNARTHY